MIGADFLDFAGIPPARVRAVPVEQMVAEKVHAYVLPRGERENTRVRDLVDLVLLLDTVFPSAERIRAAVERTFAVRGQVAVPLELPMPPEGWKAEFEALAAEVDLAGHDLALNFGRLARAWEEIFGR